MSGSFDQRINSPTKPEQPSLADSVGEMFSRAAGGLDTAVQKAEADAGTLSASIHLPSLDLFDRGGQTTAQAAGADAHAKSAPPAQPTEHPQPTEQAQTAQHVAAAEQALAAWQPAESHPSFFAEAGNVAKELGKGALNEIEHHPLQLVETAAVSFAVGASVTAAAGLAVGAGIIAAPVVGTAALVVGGVALAGTAIVGGYEAYEHRDAIIHNTEVTANPDAYSAKDVVQARQGVQNFGGAALETGVGLVAGIAGGMAGKALASSVTDALAASAADGAAPAGKVVGTTGDGAVPAGKGVGTTGDGAVPAGKGAVVVGDGATTASNGATSVSDGATSTVEGAVPSDKIMAGSGVPEVKTVNANLADGRAVNVSLQTGADGGSQVAQVQMPDGSVITRQGETSRWAVGGGGPGETVWDGDVRLNDQGKLSFVYKYEKAPSLVSVEARLPDGSKIALANADGSLSLPGSTVDALSQRLPEAGAQSVSGLKLDISPDRLQLDEVSTDANVNTKYVLNLNTDEAASVRQLAASDASIKIVPGDTPVGPVAAPGTAAGEAGAIGENVPGAYEYPTPMPDHTASVALFSKGDDGNWKVLIGLREREPFAGRSALPGGFLDMSGSTVEAPADAATRELAEETGIKTTTPDLVRIGDALGRDARNRIIDFQYSAVASKEDMASLFAGDDLKDLQVLDVQKLLDDPSSLAFDHHEMLSAAYKHLLATVPAESN